MITLCYILITMDIMTYPYNDQLYLIEEATNIKCYTDESLCRVHRKPNHYCDDRLELLRRIKEGVTLWK